MIHLPDDKYGRKITAEINNGSTTYIVTDENLDGLLSITLPEEKSLESVYEIIESMLFT